MSVTIQEKLDPLLHPPQLHRQAVLTGNPTPVLKEDGVNSIVAAVKGGVWLILRVAHLHQHPFLLQYAVKNDDVRQVV